MIPEYVRTLCIVIYFVANNKQRSFSLNLTKISIKLSSPPKSRPGLNPKYVIKFPHNAHNKQRILDHNPFKISINLPESIQAGSWSRPSLAPTACRRLSGGLTEKLAACCLLLRSLTLLADDICIEVKNNRNR